MGRSAALVLVAVALLGLAACGDDDDEESGGTTGGQSTAQEISVKAGINDPNDVTIAVLAYMPQNVTVTEGTTVSWALPGPEPHSVTFFPPGQAPPPPGSDEALFAPTPAPNGVYDGRSLVNSGLVPLGPQAAPPFKLRFDTAGRFTYVCVIHPLMTGTVEVVPAGQRADTQADVTARGDTEERQWLAEGREAKRNLTSKPVASTRNSDGSTTWTVEMGATSPHTDILAFAPVEAPIRPGDQVRFVNNSQAPHTATFAGQQSLPQDPTDPRVEQPAKGPSPQTLNRTEFFNTGLLPPDAPPGQGPPLPARSFTFVVPTAGDYAYVCLLHVASGMSGLLKVA